MERGGNSATAIDPYDMDELTYNYITGTNQLDYVTDAATGTYSDDISGGQSTGNYTYDLIGNLISDNAEGINNITWNVYGKISSIDKVSGPDLTFAYDPMGNRIMKLVDDGSALIYTYYLRDAQGNVLSTYSRIDDASDDIITLSELHIYGSSRLGIMVEDLDMSTTITSDGHSQRILGKKRYELNNHLGNVLTVISDRRFGTEQGTTGLIKYYEADVLQAQDYYPFGMLTPGRNWSAGSEYRFGFNGKESDAETYGEGNIYDYGFRIYNSRLGKFLSVDPLTQSYPWFTPYQFAGNKPIVAIDLDGMEEYVIIDRATATGNEIVLKSVYDFKGHLVNQERVINGNNYSNHKILVIKFDDAGKQQFETYENIADLSGNHQLVFEAIVSKRIEGEFQPNEGKKKYENATLITQSILISNKENNIKLPPPSLKIQFVGGKDDFISIEDARKQIVPVVDYLNTNPDSKIHITGHTGADNSLLKEGNSSNILSQVTEGEYNTIGELQIGRAQAVEGLLIEKGIDPNRITVGTGTQRSSDANRRVGIKIMDNE